MHNSTRNPFTTIRTEGALLPIDLLQRIVAGNSALGGLDTESYHLAGSEKLNEAINRSWNRLLGAWATFQTARSRLSEGDAGTTLTRERWLMPLFQELGYGRLQAAKPVMLEGKEYRVSHTWGETPIHLVGCGVNLERRQPGVTGAAKSSPHSLVQEYLNRNPNQLWGLLSNGLTLRVLRDNASLTRQAYLEFDLEAMLTGEVYADFVVLWLTCHQSRIECPDQKPENCWLEVWSKAAQEQGTRALDKLRDGVEQAITALGGGFLTHPGNTNLRARLRSGELTRQGFYRQLLRLVYRLIFLFASEDRDLLLDPKASPAARDRYLRYYSATHLRHLADNSRGGRHPDLYATLCLVSAMLGGREPTGTGPKGLGLPVLGSFLFSSDALPNLEAAELENSALLLAVHKLAFILDGNTRRVVDYRNLGTRELGSVYESLLELHPQINLDAGTFELIVAAGNARKTTGSYYTAEDLIKVLLDSALDPVILQVILRAGPSVEAQIAALLALKVCDPACGSGHFLIAAARRIARRLAQLRSGDEEPSPDMIRTALRDVIQHCVYGVDINPMSVELCKVNLWLESIEPGKPLSFLEAHIQCGDSLVGVAPGLDISEIPDEAFNPAPGDDKSISSALKKRNKIERSGQMGLGIFMIEDEEDLKAWMAHRAQSLDDLPEETAEQVGRKAQNYQEYLSSPQYHRRKIEYDLWTAAFFWKMEIQPGAISILAPTQEFLRQHRSGGKLPQELIRRVEDVAERLNFMHWQLRFPKIFTGKNPGFDCVLGNPPWEAGELIEKEFFAVNAPNIATIRTKAKRALLIKELADIEPELFKTWGDTRRDYAAQSNFFKNSNRFPLGCVGKLNTYRLFAEIASKIINRKGRIGQVLKTGIVTAQDSQPLFGAWVSSNQVVSVYDFMNLNSIFPAVVANERFCLLTTTGDEGTVEPAVYAFGLLEASQIKDDSRKLRIDAPTLRTINPNDLSVPPVTSQRDLTLLHHIHTTHPILRSLSGSWNPWRIHYAQGHLNSASGSSLFSDLTLETLLARGATLGIDHQFELNGKRFFPLYEGKFISQVNHRFGSFEEIEPEHRFGVKAMPNNVAVDKLIDPFYEIQPRYWLVEDDANDLYKQKRTELGWLFTFRDVCRAIVDARTVQACVMPRLPCLDGCPLLIFDLSTSEAAQAGLFFNSLWQSYVFDYTARQKIHGAHLTQAIAYQLPVPTPEAIRAKFLDKKFADYILPRSLELTYVTYSLSSIATGVGYQDKPFTWNEERRFLLRCELDAIFFHLYKINREDVDYILESFPIIKRREQEQFGEYRTKLKILEIYDNIQNAKELNEPYQSQLNPSPDEFRLFGSELGTNTKKITTQVGYSTDGSIQLPDPGEQTTLDKQDVNMISNTPKELTEQKSTTIEAQPMLSDFGLYKCGICGKMVMGFEKESHEQEKHGGKSVEWRKVR